MIGGCALAGGDHTSSTQDDVKLGQPLADGELTLTLDKPTIRAQQFWIDDATFDLKWTSMLSAPIEFFGGADSTYHTDLGALPARRLPGHETLCHGDPKLDNFGWTVVDGTGVFSDNDFDDAGYCAAAADALRYLVATDLWFGDPTLDEAALDAYVQTLADPNNAIAIDPTNEPSWPDVRTKGLAKDTSGDTIVLGGEVQAATQAEIDAVTALANSDWRFPPYVLDVTRDVRTDGGSAGLRRFWLLTEDYDTTRTITELKELTTPGTEFGRHSKTLDGPDRFDVLKPYWWGSADELDHFTVYVLGGRFVVRDRMIRTNPKPNKMTPDQITNMVQAEASLLALAHAGAWGHVATDKLHDWLRDSSAMLTARWRAAYTAAGGH
jgi:hypothetical protein